MTIFRSSRPETLAQVFSCEFCEISKNTFFTEHLQWLLLNLIILFLYSNDLFDNDKRQSILIHCEVLTNFTKIFWKTFPINKMNPFKDLQRSVYFLYSNVFVDNMYWMLPFKIHVFDALLFEDTPNRGNSEIWKSFLPWMFSLIFRRLSKSVLLSSK